MSQLATMQALPCDSINQRASFATLALSNHLGISSLAKLLCVGILLMLLANMIVLPALLAWLDGARDLDRPGNPRTVPRDQSAVDQMNARVPSGRTIDHGEPPAIGLVEGVGLVRKQNDIRPGARDIVERDDRISPIG